MLDRIGVSIGSFWRLGLLAGLAACGPLTTFYKPGETVARMERDWLNCEVLARKQAPVDTRLRDLNDIRVPEQEICDSAGTCWTEPAHYIDGGVDVTDVNADLRARLARQCMGDRGYRPVDIPICGQSIARDTAPGRTTRMPPLTGRSCAITNRDGSWQIVTRD